jgi:hypothetical protein
MNTSTGHIVISTMKRRTIINRDVPACRYDRGSVLIR